METRSAHGEVAASHEPAISAGQGMAAIGHSFNRLDDPSRRRGGRRPTKPYKSPFCAAQATAAAREGRQSFVRMFETWR